jgi:hypothetical protein
LREATLLNPWRLALMLAIAFALAVTSILAPIPVRAGAAGQKVVVIVGPVGGGSIQTNYLNRGESIADAAEARGATVVRVFSPNATYAAARAAVNGANIVVYIGHGSGYPNPYSSTLQTAWNNGWGLNAIAGVDAYDPTGHGHTIGGSHPSMLYCGEAALEGKPKPTYVSSSQWCYGGKITPAPNWVMVFSNACYAPGAGETEQTTPTSESVARTRVQYFSRPYLGLGGTYFASDLGSRSVVEAILDNPDVAFGDIFRMGTGFSASAVRGFPHALSSGKQVWIQKTSGPGGLMSYWYAFGGDPSRTPAGGTAPYTLLPPRVTALTPSGASYVDPAASMTATFSQDMQGVDGSTFTLRDAGGSLVPASVTYDSGTRRATLDPDAPLAYATQYTATLYGMTDLSDQPLLSPTTWTFRTQGGPWLSPGVAFVLKKGTHTGYKLTVAGAVTGSKTATTTADSTGTTTANWLIANQTGEWLWVTTGTFAGYWLRESDVAYLTSDPHPAATGADVTYNPAVQVLVRKGTHTGYKLTSTGALMSARTVTVSADSLGMTTNRWAKANQTGRWFWMTSGPYAGYWLRESDVVFLTGN